MSNARDRELYELMCAALDERSWKYKRHDEECFIEYGMNGEDIPMSFLMSVHNGAVQNYSVIPAAMDEEHRVDGAVVVAFVNNLLPDGCFDYDLQTGRISFRLCYPIMDALPGKELFYHVIDLAGWAVDRYNDSFLMLAKGLISLNDFIKKYSEQ